MKTLITLALICIAIQSCKIKKNTITVFKDNTSSDTAYVDLFTKKVKYK
jgi:hypothetical protein